MSNDSSAKYYQDNSGRQQKKAQERYLSLSKAEKEKKKWEYLPENEKQKLYEFIKKYCKMRKHPSLYLRDDYKKLFLLGQFAFFRQVRGFFVRVEIIEWA